ncbi:MAG: hypothetical protein C5B54_04755 [Acidobacteria bacterium]|nr:MAG: hypothetical protein C5B54_04755 [Acidobacteriota bacterium]
MNKVRRAHDINIALCDDISCNMVHIVFSDENMEPIAEAQIDPAQGAIVINLLKHVWREARQRLEPPEPPEVH